MLVQDYKINEIFLGGEYLMNTCMVLYSIWEMECCGVEFGVSDKIKWIVVSDFSLVEPIKEKMDYVYSAHEQYEENRFYILNGIVKDIKLLYEKYEPAKENDKFLEPVECKMFHINHSSEYEDEIEEFRASAYIVQLEDYTIRAAKMDEVSFC